MEIPLRRFDGRVALVTGAASGIGRATVARLAAEGARVFGVDVARAALAEVAKGAPAGAELETALCDVTDEAAVDATVAACVARFGRLDTLVNVAGILRFDHFHELRTEDWNRILAVNLTGTFFMCRAAIPHLLKTRGNIVNVSSTAALAGQPWAAAYSASKGGVLSLTRTIAVDYLKQGLRANCICPGDVDTPMRGVFQLPEGADPKLLHRVMSPFGPGNPAGVAGVIAMLASDDAAHITGEDIRIDGGTRA
jgi:meso-butanediol dehydrogenase/(S,S)-butanediol dehydrogenase/diacetyl reductase